MDWFLPWPLPIKSFLFQLSTKRAPAALLWAAEHYREHGRLPRLEQWPEPHKAAAQRAVGRVRFAWLADGTIGRQVDWENVKEVEYWLLLDAFSRKGIPLGRCGKCGKYFVDLKHKGKGACSSECAGTLRARAYRIALKAKPTAYRRYLRRMRETMRRRRAEGLA